MRSSTHQGPSPELGNKCPGDATSSPCEAHSSRSEGLAACSVGLALVSRLQVSFTVDLASTLFARLSYCLRVSGMTWESQIFLIGLELAKEKKLIQLEASWEWHHGISLHLWTLSQPEHPQVSPFPVVAVTDYHALGGLRQQKFTLSHFWRPEVQSQDVSRATLPPKPRGQNLS